MLLVKATQISDRSVLYEKKFGLSSSRCFVLICLDEINLRWRFSQKSTIKFANCAFLSVSKRVISLYGLL